MSSPRVVGVVSGSPADKAGILVDDEFLSLNGEKPRDVIQYQLLTDEENLDIEVRRGGLPFDVSISKHAGEPLGVNVHSALFDQIRTCDNHCEFCFIYQLPPGMRKSLYVKDDDYRLSFLYGNFTTLTRFTEADLERVVTEGLSPLNVSIHATDPNIRNEMLRNRRGGPSLRWLKALLSHGIEVHGQIVVCPGINDGAVLDDTLCTIFEQYRSLTSLCVVPLGVSKHSNEPRMRPHSSEESNFVIELVERWQKVFLQFTGRRIVHAADEYYLLADRAFPTVDEYEGFGMYEDGVGIYRTFEQEFYGRASEATNPSAGFFAWVDGAPAEGYRAERVSPVSVELRKKRTGNIGILTGEYGAKTLEPLIKELERSDIRVISVANTFFGGNVAVAGLMVGEDIARALVREPDNDRYLLPDVCLSEGRFLDGMMPEELPREIEIIPTDGIALRQALGVGQ
jgi:putative radical SAM enzyme (TIGR03279 family)